MRVALWGTPVNRATIAEQLGTVAGLEIVQASDADSLARALPGAEVMMMPVRFYNATTQALLRQHVGTLKWIQLINAGYDALIDYPPPAGILVTSAGNALAPAVAEHAVALLLALGRQFELAISQQRSANWDDSMRGNLRVIDGRTVVVVGYGAIGQQVALRARAFGAHVIGVRRTPGGDQYADEMVHPDQLDTVLARADAIVVTVPLSEQTRRMFNTERFACCKKGAYFVNVARGGVVDQDALVAALANGQIGAAGLDVTDPEPLPASHPLWHLPRVIITPHVSGSDSNLRIAKFVTANVRRYLAGEPLEAIVAAFSPESSSQPI